MNIESLLTEHSLTRFQDLYREAAPSVRLTFKRDTGQSTISRAGGRPSLPIGFSWPVGQSKLPLAFLCQIDLAELTSCARFVDLNLPEAGLLSFFYDAFDGPWGNQADQQAGWRVFFFTDIGVLKQTDPPANLPVGSQFTPCAINFKEELSYPAVTIEMAAFAEQEPDELDELDHDDEHSAADEDLDLYEQYLQFSDALYGGRIIHRMFGHGQDIAGDFRLDCEIASRDLELGDDFDFTSKEGESVARGSEEWILLLQLDSDASARMMWVDNGRLYFAIRKQDLAARRFDRVWMICETN